MEQFVTDEWIGLRYELVVDYYLIAGEQTYRHMGTATLVVSETAPQGTLFRTADKRKAERLPCRPKRASRENVLSAGKTAFRKRGSDGNAQSGKPNAVGAEDEQHPQCCYGDCFKRFDLRITSYRKGCCRRRRLFFFGKYSRSHKVP